MDQRKISYRLLNNYYNFTDWNETIIAEYQNVTLLNLKLPQLTYQFGWESNRCLRIYISSIRITHYDHGEFRVLPPGCVVSGGTQLSLSLKVPCIRLNAISAYHNEVCFGRYVKLFGFHARMAGRYAGA